MFAIFSKFISKIQKRAIMMILCSLLCMNVVYSLMCYECGEYNDGVGSITPCHNFSLAHLKACVANGHQKPLCAQYAMNAIVVKTCLPGCKEKEESWGSVYCCTEDGCNKADDINFSSSIPLLVIYSLIPYFIMFLTKHCIV